MNGKLAKEERRNLVKAMGETATDALERARAEVLQLRMEHAAIARTVADFKNEIAGVATLATGYFNGLGTRIDGASAWCEKNERFAMEHLRMTTTFAERMNLIIHGGFFTRLRWVVFGILPAVPDSAFQRANQVQS